MAPILRVRDATEAIEFYERVFSATEVLRLTDPGGKVLHAEIEIGGARIMLSDEFPSWENYSPLSLGGTPVHIHLYVEDVDAVFSRAIAAGAKVLLPVGDQFYGDRSGRLEDPLGHVWIIATHGEDISPEEMQRRATGLFST